MQVAGNRIVSMESFLTELLPHVQCPSCKSVGTLVSLADEERSYGLAGTLVMRCLRCDQPTLSWAHSSDLPKVRKDSGKLPPGPAHKELNLRAALAACQTGIGFQQLERFMGIMDLPSMSLHTYQQVLACCSFSCLR